MIFEWDENKRSKTLLERGIDFIDAALIWDDPLRQERLDNRMEYGEKRYQTIGRAAFGVLFVVYTERVSIDGVQMIRIISARVAKRKEIAQYEARTFKLGYAS